VSLIFGDLHVQGQAAFDTLGIVCRELIAALADLGQRLIGSTETVADLITHAIDSMSILFVIIALAIALVICIAISAIIAVAYFAYLAFDVTAHLAIQNPVVAMVYFLTLTVVFICLVFKQVRIAMSQESFESRRLTGVVLLSRQRPFFRGDRQGPRDDEPRASPP
jgi:hypothetical protein